jgi:hypothetical protein
MRKTTFLIWLLFMALANAFGQTGPTFVDLSYTVPRILTVAPGQIANFNLKYEEVFRQEYHDLAEARTCLGRFIDKVYNQQRLHFALGYRPPAEFEQALQAQPHPEGLNAAVRYSRRSPSSLMLVGFVMGPVNGGNKQTPGSGSNEVTDPSGASLDPSHVEGVDLSSR